MPYSLAPIVGALVFGWLAVSVAAQELQLLPCAEISFFAPACVTVTAVPAPQPPPPPMPLFTPDSMAKDTPPLLVQLLEEPTLDNATKFLEWQTQRYARIQEVQHLLRQITRPNRHSHHEGR